MAWVTEEEYQAAKQVRAYEYLQTYQPGRLKKTRTRNEWQLQDHDSFKINEITSKWHWKSRDIGGMSALRFLMQVDGMETCGPLGMAAVSASCLVGGSYHCLCHKTRYQSVTDLTSADRKTGSALFYFLYTVHTAVCVHIHNRLCVRHRYLLLPKEKLSKRGGAWLCQMGRCSFHLQALPGQAVHPESHFNPKLPHGIGLL